MNNGQYFKDILGNSDAILEQVQENVNNIQSQSQSVEELCTPEVHVDECKCFEKRAEQIKLMQDQLEKERQEYELKKELRRKEKEREEREEREEVARKEREEAERVEKEKKRLELVQLEQTIREISNTWHEKNDKKKQLEGEIKNLKKDCDNLYDKYSELASKYNKLSNTKKYKLPATYKNEIDYINLVNTFPKLYDYDWFCDSIKSYCYLYDRPTF